MSMGLLDEIRLFLGEDWSRTESLIRDSLRSDIVLLNATNGSLLSRLGKQLRPMLALLAARACAGAANEDSIRVAATAELMHNATLLHDDVVDESQRRRGAPTVMALLGGRASVLIGDFWLVRAVGNLLSSRTMSGEVVRIFAKTLSDLAEGEMLQMEKADSGDTDERDYLRIIYSKTASLFEAAALSGAVSAEAPEEWTAALAGFARNLGLAFQIKDDIFDYTGGDALGKPVGIDLREQKITLPLLCALDSAPEEAPAIRTLVGQISDHPELADNVRSFVLDHGGVEKAVEEMDKYIAEAVFCLEELPQSPEKSYLAELARFVGERTF
jgi:octaprenyl-diphosphate synthase